MRAQTRVLLAQQQKQAFERAWRERQAWERREEQHNGMAHSQWEAARLYRDTCTLRIKRGEQKPEVGLF